MKSFIKRSLTAMIAIFSRSLLFACSSAPSHTYWNVVKKSANGVDLEYFANVYLDDVSSTKPIKEIWVNVSGFADEEVTVNLAFASSSSATTYYHKQKETFDRLFASDAEGWVKIYDGSGISYRYCLVTLSDGVHFNEIVFLTNDGEVLKGHVAFAGERSPVNTSVKREYEGDELKLVDKIMDEQEKFDRNEASKLYDKAVKLNSK